MAVVCTDTTHLSNSAQLDLTATDAVLTGLPFNLQQLFLLYLWNDTVRWHQFEGRNTESDQHSCHFFFTELWLPGYHIVPWHNLDRGFAPYARNALICSLSCDSAVSTYVCMRAHTHAHTPVLLSGCQSLTSVSHQCVCQQYKEIKGEAELNCSHSHTLSYTHTWADGSRKHTAYFHKKMKTETVQKIIQVIFKKKSS